MKPSDYVRLWRAFRRRLRSERDCRKFQAFQARQILDYLVRHGVPIEGRFLLDLGSGVAGYSRVFARRGACVIGIDLAHPRESRIEGMSQVQASALAVPLRNESVDVIFCASLIEHVAEPGVLLSEIERTLRAGGSCYISFPPYYSPIGGHEFSPFHYLGERIAIRIVRHSAKVPGWVRQFYDLPEKTSSFSEAYGRWGLHKMTIAKFRRLLSSTKLVCLDTSTRYMPINFSGWPLVGEVLTWHAQFLLAKPRS